MVGASRGIGKGIALELADAGATVYVTGRTTATLSHDEGAPPGSLAQTVAEINAAGARRWASAAMRPTMAILPGSTREFGSEQGHLDVAVHSAFNASAFGPTVGRPFWELAPSLWDDLVRVGARSTYVSAVHAAPLLIASGGGLVVHISGRGAARYRYNVIYGVDKAAVDKLTADLAHELRPHGVAVVSLWPSVTRTERNRATSGVDEYGWPDPNLPVEALETPRTRAVRSPHSRQTPTSWPARGSRFWTAELAAIYGFVDEHGRTTRSRPRSIPTRRRWP